MPAGASHKREREYNKLESRFKKEHRYAGREEEVAARIVNKQRSALGETQDARLKDKQGRSPDRNLPVKDYEQLTIKQAQGRLSELAKSELKKLRSYEEHHKNRKGMIAAIDRCLQGD